MSHIFFFRTHAMTETWLREFLPSPSLMSCQSLPGSCLAKDASLLVHLCTWQLSYGGRISFRGRSGRGAPRGMRRKGSKEERAGDHVADFTFEFRRHICSFARCPLAICPLFCWGLFGALSGGMAAFYHLPASSRRHDFQANLLVR